MNEVPTYARWASLGMAAAAAVGLLLNHFLAESQNAARLMILGVGPLALFLGIGGAVEPKVLWALGKYGEHLPTKYKVVGGLLGGLGVLVSLLLAFVVYRIGLQ